jgi:integrase
MATIEERGPCQFRVKIRRKNITQTRTFETRKEAEAWARVIEGKITADEYVDRSFVRDTTLSQACDWYEQNLPRGRPDTKNKLSKLNYWRHESPFAHWSLVAILPADLLRWRRQVLDEDNAESGEIAGPEAEVGPQTVIHRLNVLSQVYNRWALAHSQSVSNPVIRGVRPSKPDGRNRRLSEGEEARLLQAARASTRPWLEAAIIIALETCMRQSELAGLTWDRVILSRARPYADLVRTKNGESRRIALSARAVTALRSLMPAVVPLDTGKRTVLPVETGRGIAHAFRDAITDEDFPGLRWHDLRHEAISRLFEHTELRDCEIMTISGHLRPEMLTRYVHLRGDQLGDKLPGGRLNPLPPAPAGQGELSTERCRAAALSTVSVTAGADGALRVVR